jgi:hypothetical protein
MRLDALRAELEDTLIAPLVSQAREVAVGTDCAAYVADLVPNIKAAPPSSFLAFLSNSPWRAHHYRNFLIQSSVDLLAEASASALGIVGEYGEPQSALFRILIDEFGYGVHNKKHSVLFRSTLRGFDLSEEYNAYWPLFDTQTLELHNVIHFMFQSPRNLFLQIGFLLYAEASYQRSTEEHFRYLKRFHPSVDGIILASTPILISTIRQWSPKRLSHRWYPNSDRKWGWRSLLARNSPVFRLSELEITCLL